MQAFILAGGFATRLWPLTEKRAKPLLPVAGQPIVTRLLEKIPGEIPVTVSTNAAFAEGFKKWHREIDRPGLALVIEETTHDDQKLGTLGALAQWIGTHGIQDDILVLTGDNEVGFSVADFLSAFRPGTALVAAYDLGEREKASAFGTVLTDPHHPTRVVGFEEKPSNPKTSLVSTGISVLPRETIPILLEFAKLKPDNVGGIFEEYLRRGIPVSCFVTKEPWFDIGNFASYLDAHRHIVGHRHILGTGATLDGSSCHGSIAIGTGSKVLASELTDTIVFSDCRITDCVLKNCIIDDRCTLRGVDLSNKMIRENTILELTD